MPRLHRLSRLAPRSNHDTIARRVATRGVASVVVAIVSVWCAAEAFAAAPVPVADIKDLEGYAGFLDGMEDRIKDGVGGWTKTLQNIAYRVLFVLLVISAAVRGSQLLFQGNDFSGIIFEIVKLLAIGGFYSAAIMYAPAAADVIIRSFTGAAELALGGDPVTSAGKIFARGADHAGMLMDEADGFEWLLMGILAIFIIVGFAVIGAYALLVVAEAWIVTAAGIVLLGFGALQWTEDFARRYIVYAFSVGAKLFGLYLTAGFGLMLVDSVSGIPGPLDRAFALLGSTIIASLLVVSIPGMIQGIVNGSSIGMGTGAIMGLLTAATKVAAGGARGIAKTGVGTTDAVKAAAAGMGPGGVGAAIAAGGGGAKGTVALAGRAAKVGAAAVAASVGQRLAPEGSVGAALKGIRAGAEEAASKSGAGE